ncbi:MAG: 4Fe-4S binding protein [Eggerthellaceae bacterium]|nr:4Fe-4S binding protein [Eggerthellaceae bacterium]
MPNIADLVEIAESLGSSHVFVAPHRCVKVRNRNAKCSKCVDACANGAVQVGGNKLSVTAALCVGCHACTTVCPTEALVPLDPQDEELTASIAQATLAAEGDCVFACARMAARHIADPAKYAQVSCLSRMEESLLVQLAARGIQDIVLVDGVCSTCKYRANSPLVDTVVGTANQLLEAQGSAARVRRVSEFPESVLAEDAHASYAASRRGFFTQAGSMTRSAAKTAAEKTVEQTLGMRKKQEATLRERLQMGKGNSLPQFQSDRHMRLLDALYELGESREGDERLLSDSETATVDGLDEGLAPAACDLAAGAACVPAAGAACVPAAGAACVPAAPAAYAPTAIEGAGEPCAIDVTGEPGVVDDVCVLAATDGAREQNGASAGIIDTRLFGSIRIDTEKCTSCGMCTTFCPTGALKKSEEEVPEGEEGVLLEFSVTDCVQCNLCADACLKKCITVDSTMSLDELFDFEPRFILLPKAPARKGVIQSLRDSKKK